MTHIPMPEDWFATLLRMPDVLTKADVQELSEDEWEVVRRVVEEAINIGSFRQTGRKRHWKRNSTKRLTTSSVC